MKFSLDAQDKWKGHTHTVWEPTVRLGYWAYIFQFNTGGRTYV